MALSEQHGAEALEILEVEVVDLKLAAALRVRLEADLCLEAPFDAFHVRAGIRIERGVPAFGFRAGGVLGPPFRSRAARSEARTKELREDARRPSRASTSPT